mgnify:CR=1 FL=1
MPQPDNISAGQLVALMEAMGFYHESSGAPWFISSDSKRRRGPGGIYLDVDEATTFPVAIIRRYLIERGMHPVHLETAINRVLADDS